MVLNLAHDRSGKCAQEHLTEDNNVKQMAVAGSKGSFVNISQMSVCAGRQSVGIPFSSHHCTLPHCTKDGFGGVQGFRGEFVFAGFYTSGILLPWLNARV